METSRIREEVGRKTEKYLKSLGVDVNPASHYNSQKVFF